tara:strand:+ start:5820 stop:6044 length:225 start_codon:yes stop_codon:yes gene_type:complete
MFVAVGGGVPVLPNPCVLAIVPLCLVSMGGASRGDMRAGAVRRKVLLPAIFFGPGLATVFLLIGLTAAVSGIFL